MKVIDRIALIFVAFWVGFSLYYFGPQLQSFWFSEKRAEYHWYLITSNNDHIGYLTRGWNESRRLFTEEAGVILAGEFGRCFVESELSVRVDGKRVSSYDLQIKTGSDRRTLEGTYNAKATEFAIESKHPESEPALFSVPKRPRFIPILFAGTRVATKNINDWLLDPYRGVVEEFKIKHLVDDSLNLLGRSVSSSQFIFERKKETLDFYLHPDKKHLLLRELGYDQLEISVGRELGRANRASIRRKSNALSSAGCRSPKIAFDKYTELLGNFYFKTTQKKERETSNE